MKRFILILDGLGDVKYARLHNKTPLEAAHTPAIDMLAEKGKTGLMYPISRDIAPESDQAMLALLGFNPFSVYTGRGPLEAYGAGVDFKQGEDVVLRCNFVTLGEGEKITSIRAGRPSFLEGKLALRKLKKIKIPNTKLVTTVGYRSVLIISGGLSPKVTNTHPGYNIVNNFVTSAQPIRDKILKIKNCVALDRAAKETANIINSYTKEAQKVLKGRKKINGIVMRGAGNKLPNLKPLEGGSWAIITEMPVEKAIGKIVGMDLIKPKKDLVKTVAKIWEKYDNLYMQIKGPDSFGHDGLCEEKKESIEKIDKEFLKPLLNKVAWQDCTICITADHSTPCRIMAHAALPVPILIYGKGKDSTKTFGEEECAKGRLGRILGKDLLKLLM